MLGASLYIIVCSTRNRIAVRLRRLREPRYLIGAVAGVAYLYFSFFARAFGGSRAIRRRRAAPADAFFAANAGLGVTVGGLVLFAGAVAAWLLPVRAGLLDFSAAETAFLLPAPISRRQLVLHRLLRSQLGALFGAAITGLIVPGSGLERVRSAVIMWLALLTARVYFAGVALARPGLARRGRRLASWTALGIVLAAVAVVGAAVVRLYTASAPGSAQEIVDRLTAVATTGASAVVLWPFAALVRPAFVPAGAPFAAALAASAAVFAATLAWTLASVGAIDDAIAASVEERAIEATAERPASRARRVPLRLAPAGRPEMLFLWKGATQSMRAIDGRLLRLLVPITIVTIGLSSAMVAAYRVRGAAGVATAVSFAVTAFSVVLGPQLMRSDLRGDLDKLDVIKTWPVGAGAVIRGEMLWPTLLVSAIAWIGIASAALFGATALPGIVAPWRGTFALAAALAAVALIAAQFTVQNAVATLFPAWVPTGNQRPRGIDAMGQRLVMLAGVVVSVVVMAIPGVIPAALVWLVLRSFAGPFAFVPSAAVFAAVVFVEIVIATELLGPAYDRLDILSIERAD